MTLDWPTARLAMILALNTTMRGCELKSLRWRDIDLMSNLLTVHKSKTDAGERVIPLNGVAYTAIMELRERAKGFSGLESDHFVFPRCENEHIDPTKPQKSWRTAWRQLTKAIECPECGKLQRPAEMCRNESCKADIENLKSSTAGLRFHDLRHHAITELAESQTSDQTIMAIAGHVSQKMLAHYSHVRLDAKRKALEVLSGSEKNNAVQGGQSSKSEREARDHVTSHATTADATEKIPAQLLENDGRPEWIRTIDLFRVNLPRFRKKRT